jgi:hypothetical protein
MDEYRTSKVHAKCHGDDLQQKHLRAIYWRKKREVSDEKIEVLKTRQCSNGTFEELVVQVQDPWSLRWCPTCRKFVARDFNSATIMMQLLADRLKGYPRPQHLSRKRSPTDPSGLSSIIPTTNLGGNNVHCPKSRKIRSCHLDSEFGPDSLGIQSPDS